MLAGPLEEVSAWALLHNAAKSMQDAHNGETPTAPWECAGVCTCNAHIDPLGVCRL